MVLFIMLLFILNFNNFFKKSGFLELRETWVGWEILHRKRMLKRIRVIIKPLVRLGKLCFLDFIALLLDSLFNCVA